MKSSIGLVIVAVILAGCSGQPATDEPALYCDGLSQTDCSIALARLSTEASDFYNELRDPTAEQTENMDRLRSLSLEWQTSCLIGVNDEGLTPECDRIMRRFVEVIPAVKPDLAP
ncbi:hypothetical protein [Glutamicibacter soli]|uniref:hypothetical protein n=1 Tax=Glutamicibacter soli TaxID=453836 RepID=UPI003FD42C97